MAPSTGTKSRIHELLAELTTGVERLGESSDWQRYLDYQGRFHRYSFANTLLIASQFPAATQVAGFHTWRRLRRVVRRGEHAIWILAPIRCRAADGDEAPEQVTGFRPVAVFDLSQTEGAPPPAPLSRLVGDDPNDVFRHLDAVATKLGFSVAHCELDGGVNGDCSHTRRLIRVECRNAPAQQVKTLAHELVHVLLHKHIESRALAELEAESAAYVICAALGIDSSDYSLGYVASWAGGGEQAAAAIRQSCGRIQQVADRILAHVVEEADGERVSDQLAVLGFAASSIGERG